MICLCTLDEVLDGHRCKCPDHEFCGEVECDKNPDEAQRDAALGIGGDDE